MDRKFYFVALVLLGLAGAQAHSLWPAWDRDHDDDLVHRDWVLVRSQAFDPDGRVGVDAGADGRPGIAWVDDGANGIVDDPVELGATGSDDRLIVVSGDEFAAQPETLRSVLQRGAWVDVDDMAATRRFWRKERR